MDVLSLRAAAGGGSIDGIPAASLVAAGFTLLQRSPALVRALAGKRAAILLPTSPQFLVALAAADGRGAVLMSPLCAPAEVADQLEGAGVGAVITIASLATRLPPGTVHVLLDAAPAHATVVIADGARTRVDLGSHFGLDVEGDVESPGRDEECVVVYTSPRGGRATSAILTHRALLASARQTVAVAALGAGDHLLAVLPWSDPLGLTIAGIAPLLAGARVSTMAHFDPIGALDKLANDGVTILAGLPASFAELLTEIGTRGRFGASPLRICVCGGAPPEVALQRRWTDATGVELRPSSGLLVVGA